ncbi:MAG: hypothetical protein Q7J73_06540 [Dehalococcoidales bacterium]|nr:hypothetical protein [Dehalococcoidales bacterium]
MKNIGLVSTLIYTGISVLAASLFLVATLPGRYSIVERAGGTTWVFILSMIILMPIVTPLVKKKLGSHG